MGDSTARSSRLFYYGTNIEVQIGDRIRVKRFLRRAEECIVCYLPGISQRRREFGGDCGRRWAIKATNGNVYPIVYDPDNFQPPKYFSFIEKTNQTDLPPDEVLR